MSDIERTRESLSDLSRMMDTVEQQSLSLAKRFGDMSDESKKWTFVSRILSGTGLWRLQNRIRAVGNAMKFYKDAQLDKIKSDIEEAEGMAKLQEALKSKKMQQDVLAKLAEDSEYEPKKDEEEYENKMKIVNQYKLLAATIEQTTHSENAHEIALARTKKAYDTVGEAITDLQEKRITKYQKALDKQDKRENILTQRKIIREAKNAKKLLKQEQKRVKEHVKAKEQQMLVIEEIERQIRNNSYATEKVRKGLMDERMAAQVKLEKAQGLIDTSNMAIVGGISEARGAADKLSGAKKELKELTGLKVMLKTVGEKITEPLVFVKDKVMSGTEEYRKQVREAKGLRNKMSEAFSPITKVMKFAAKNLMFFTLLLMGAFLVFSIIRKIFENAEVMTTIMDTVKGVIEGLMVVLSGVFDIFGAFFGGGTFGERLQLLLKGIVKLWSGIGKILGTVIGAAIKLLGGLLLGTVEFLGQLLVGILRGTANFLLGLLRKGVDGWIKLVKFWFVDVLWGGLIWPIVSPIVDAAKGVWEMAVNIWDSFADFLDDIDLFASGGTSRGGMAVVGERGPELVSLSAGSTVYSNTESKKMLGGGGSVNNISVNVSGRVGSTDSELRDIAKKIGKMVSAEINRTTSSSTNVRF